MEKENNRIFIPLITILTASVVLFLLLTSFSRLSISCPSMGYSYKGSVTLLLLIYVITVILRKSIRNK